MAVFRNSLGKINSKTNSKIDTIQGSDEHASYSGAVRSIYDDFIEGLQMSPKKIAPKYFYDAKGSEIFEKITQLDEYYLTKCEEEILMNQSQKILSDLKLASSQRLNIIELGAGDGRKTVHLLRAAIQMNIDLTYSPVDISAHALNRLESNLLKEFPDLKCNPIELDLETDYDKLPVDLEATNLVLYLGSSIGNFDSYEQEQFLLQIANYLKPIDAFLIGFDLKKDPAILQKAYDDSLGVTAEFNYNLLERLNKELHANFDLSKFRHWPLFNPRTGAMESWLISLCDQTISFDYIYYKLHLKTSEGIHVETSWKFSAQEILELSQKCRYDDVRNYSDEKGRYIVSLWQNK